MPGTGVEGECSYRPCSPGPETGGGIGMLGVACADVTPESDTSTASPNAATTTLTVRRLIIN